MQESASTAMIGSRTRRVYVISDLHLGGAWPSEQTRGFRMMTRPEDLARFIRVLAARPSGPSDPEIELVINGDFIDFLAEEHPRPRWLPFIRDPEVAVRVFEHVASQHGDRHVFDALAELLARGHLLTLLLGNHDLELSFPAVRRAFERRIGAGPRSGLRFLYDGEAYEVGDALIEHGNRYDPANTVDHGQLQQVRALQSRKRQDRESWSFEPPIGSRLVAELMNPIKTEYQFIDLLKPESEPLFALLLALEPRYRETIAQMAKLLRIGISGVKQKQSTRRGRFPLMFASTGDEDDAADQGASGNDDEDLAAVLGRAMPEGEARAMVEELAREDGDGAGEAATGAGGGGPVSFGITDAIVSRIGVAGLLVAGQVASVQQRLRLVQQALRAVDQDRSFDSGHEASRRYLTAAQDLGRRYRIVVFGHTHQAKEIELGGGAKYLNTGTWANLMRFPQTLFEDDSSRVMSALESFFENIRGNQLAAYIEFRPTYARLEVTADGQTTGSLHTFDPERGDVP